MARASIILTLLVVACSPQPSETGASACAADGLLEYICGLEGPEDIVQVGQTPWLLASSGAGPGQPVGAGRLYLIDSTTRSVDVLFPGTAPDIRLDTSVFPDCPGALNLQAFALHGLSLTDPAAAESIFSGKVTGQLYEWRPGWQEARPVPGTELAGPNGIEISADGRRVFVAAFGAHAVLRFDGLANKPAIADLGVLPDNLRWSQNGTLTTVGDLLGASQDCGAPTCPTGWAVYEIDPDTLTSRRIGEADATVALQCASTALRVREEIWIGTCNGDRIGVLPGP